MTPRGNVVLVPAILKVLERDVECEVLSRRLGIEPSPVFSDCSVIGAPDDLPDGEYAIEFGGIRATATKLRGLWTTFDPGEKGIERPATFAE